MRNGLCANRAGLLRPVPMIDFHATTVLAVRHRDRIVMASDGQVTRGQTVVKHQARKVRRLYQDRVLAGFAGSAADGFALFSRFEAKLEEHRGNLERAAVELARDWRVDRALRRLEAMLIVAAARATGLASDEDLRRAGMEGSLRQLGPFLAAVKATTAGYGLDLDRSLADLRTGLVEENGDHATVRLHYPLGASEIDTTLRLTRVDGHWYLDGYLEEAARLIAADTPPAPPPAVPLEALPEPPPAADDPAGR